MFIGMGVRIIPLIGSIALLVFLIGVGRFIRASGNGKDLKDSKNILIWGVIGLFALASVWGIVALLRSELGFGNSVGIPQVQIK